MVLFHARTSFHRGLVATTALVAIAFLTGGAQAQPSPAAGSETGNDAGALQEVTVTATRVTTSAQSTPVALNVYTSTDLLNEGVNNVAQLQSIDPSINISISSGAASMAIRGVASTDRTEIGDPSVPIATDGFFLNRPYTVANAFYDVNHVEVLKGPQGTLFGRNSTGGLVNILTNRPNDKYEGYINLETGDYGTINTEGAVNVPLASWAQFRLSAQELHHEGYRSLAGVSARGDDADSQSIRAQLALEPVEGLNVLIAYQNDHRDAVGDVVLNTPLTVTPNFTRQPSSFPYTLVPYDRATDSRFRWEGTYDQLPFGLALTYAGGYDTTGWHHLLEASGPAYPFAYRGFYQSETPKTWNNEVRITTPQDWRVTLQAGYFAFIENSAVDSTIFNTTQTPIANAILPFPVPTSVYTEQSAIHFLYPKIYSRSNGYFAQTGIKILDDLTFSAGARYTEDYKIRNGESYLNLPALAFPLVSGQVVTPGFGTIQEGRPTFHLGLDWKPVPTSLLYVKYDTGYKSGGFNSNGSALSVPYGPEVLKTVDLGTKNTFFDRHLEVNGALFHSDYSGYQASQLGAALGNTAGVFNVGNASIDGAEAQIVARVADIGRFDVNATYLNTSFGEGIVVYDGQSTPEAHAIGGNQLPNAPPLVLTFGFEHEFGLADLGAITARIDGKYSSHYYFEVFNFADTRQGHYFTGNLSATYAPAVGDWSVSAFVRNFTNAVSYSYATRNWNSDYNTYEFNPPLTFGVRGNYHF